MIEIKLPESSGEMGFDLHISTLDIFLFLDILKPMKLFKRYWMKKVIRGMGFSFL